MASERTYGEIPGYPPGSAFKNRDELAASAVHRPNQAGICGGRDGAESIVVSGGYVDDEDYGAELVYTGQGGNDPVTKRQIADQQLTRGNLGLARSQIDGNPIRVVRGAGGDPKHSPGAGLRYDGLFRVVDHWRDTGKDGFKIWRYRLVAIESSDPPPNNTGTAGQSAARTEATIQRLVRSTAVANGVKRLHRYKCQICGIQLSTPAGLYAEAAHIRGLGKPHNGPDVASNVLCLCPNDHLLFDAGAIYIDVNGVVRQTETGDELGSLRLTQGHSVDWAQLSYHREHHKP
ncbi:YDG/SRA domain-containing protein [Micromonospora tulbaghiae]|uniref:Restriction endonuclease n=1 Tax=Micromonospora tulbaghiae TaxID=479978 RepID=A0ABY0KS73_9ACTN|nr:YDG/SRA domain-containing protein [Micromonospora tulbaghiae]SCF05414.1 putative restriction endonuclease [Micromonospora tulbaghiae]